ncbi:FAS-associated factor 1-like isoform X2 [Cimex lectularius]|uniref:UBX domain-containing protein n=1 Tax=Cimex lectularius TaxID=79782 RepID=A0A8I6TJ48_CIMLE|nr:FAS-associated factor 1-like isoform X2 [Cimex lectularius]
MSNEDHKRDEMIVNFQSCTGIEDIAEAVRLLEEASWNIEVALKRFLPEEEGHNFHSSITNCQNSKLRNGIPLPIIERFGEFPSTSDPAQRLHLIEVFIHYNGNEMVDFRVPDSTKLADLKEIVFSETGFSPSLQILSGWAAEPDNDSMTLADLGSPAKLHLFMIAKPEPSTAYNIVHIEDDDEEFIAQESMPTDTQTAEADITIYARRLKIFDEISNKSYLLILDLDTPVGTVKAYTTYITDIPLANQVWTGWPARPNIDDDTWIGILPLSLPWHHLKVRSSNETPNIAPSTCIDLTGDTDSSPEDFEDASESFNAEDEIYIDDTITPRTEPLIPDNVEDETAGSVHFIDGFTLRYGQTSPNFLPGSLEDAIKESCMKPAKERRMLAIYLHHDGSVLSNVFCTELLCSETVLQTFGNCFLLWGWDLTNEANKNMFLASAMKNLGATVAETVRNMNTEQLPALLIVTRSRSNTELFNVIYGNIGLNDFYATLIHAVDMYSELQENEIKEEEERAVRQQIKTEQDHAFQQSLLMDRAKDEAKKQKLMLESQEEMRKKQEKEAEERMRIEEKNAVLAILPPEPEEDATDVVKIKFRRPTGDTFARRFLSHDKLETVFNFLLVEGFRIKEYKVLTSWPRRDISSFTGSTTLKDLNLHSQETLIIEER